MLCSSCSEHLKPVVAIDIDGTMGDYHSHFQSFLSQWLGRPAVRAPWTAEPLPLYDGTQPYRDYIRKAFDIDLTTFRSAKLAYRQGGSKRWMPAFIDAPQLTADLRAAGAEVWVTTTRPHDRFDRVDPDTVEWLRRNKIQYDGLLFGERKLADLADRVDPGRIVAVLDDQRDVLQDAEGAGWTSIKRGTEYNRGWSWPFEVKTLGLAIVNIKQLIYRWETTCAK